MSLSNLLDLDRFLVVLRKGIGNLEDINLIASPGHWCKAIGRLRGFLALPDLPFHISFYRYRCKWRIGYIPLKANFRVNNNPPHTNRVGP